MRVFSKQKTTQLTVGCCRTAIATWDSWLMSSKAGLGLEVRGHFHFRWLLFQGNVGQHADCILFRQRRSRLWHQYVHEPSSLSCSWLGVLLFVCEFQDHFCLFVDYPQRGEKHSNWEGGMRVSAYVSGGLVPEELRGSTSNLTCHIVDWYDDGMTARTQRRKR